MIWLNGNLVEESHALIPSSDRGFLYGDGVFTTIKVENGIVQHFDLHKERLELHCQKMNIRPPDLELSTLESVIEANQASEGAWRLKVVVTGGSGTFLDLRPRETGVILISVTPYQHPGPGPLKLAIYPYPLQRIWGDVKTLSYLENLGVKNYAHTKGCFDAVMVSQEGYILEASCANILWTVDQTLYTPSFELPIIQGISLKMNIENFRSQGYNIKFTREHITKIPKNAKLYITNSLLGLQKVYFPETLHTE